MQLRVVQLVPDARQVLICVNPRAGAQNRRAVVADLCRELAERDIPATVFHGVDELAAEASRLLSAKQLRAVVAAGGDGTIRLLAERTPQGTPLVVLPLGTENLLARYFDLTADASQLAQIIADGWTLPIDAGLAGGRLFTLMAGCGFDAEVVRRLDQSRQGHIHHLSYAKPILDAIRKYEYPELRVYYADRDWDGDDSANSAALTHEITARWVFVVNLPRYAGGLSFAPQASATDGLLDVCTFKEGSLWHGLMYLGGVMLGQHEGMEDFAHIQTRHLRVEAAAPAPYQLDGDPGGELPVEIASLPGRLTILVARSWIDRQRSSREEAPQPIP